MKVKLLKTFSLTSFITIIIFIISIIFFNISCVYAYDNPLQGLLGGAQSESHSQPGGFGPSYPSHTDTPGSTPGAHTQTIPVEYNYFYTSIEGNVYEDLGYVYEKDGQIKDDTTGRLAVKDITVVAERTSNIYNKNRLVW